MKINNRKQKDLIWHRVPVRANLCFHCAEIDVDKHQLATSIFVEENNFKPFLIKQTLNVFKLSCEWGVRLSVCPSFCCHIGHKV